MKNFAFAWLLMWALAYTAVAVIAPEISGDQYGVTIYLAMAIAIVGSLMLLEYTMQKPMPRRLAQHKHTQRLAKIPLFVVALIEVCAGVASWTGTTMWNVPFANKELFQISMAFADLISAAFMIYLIVTPTE